MPACDARYDVILSDGYASYQGGRPETHAIVDFEEERVPDDWGEPGQLVDARLRAYWTSTRKRLTYEGVGTRGQKMLWVDGTPCRARVKHRRWLRWKQPDYDPPTDPEYDDPA
jgi:hypothetical protein